VVTSNTPTPTRGRPRDDARTEAILEAAHAVLHREGWDDFKMDAVAKEAGCGLATMYRRWNTKEELAAAAMRYRFLPAFDETGDAATDLYSLTVALARDIQEMGGNCLGLLAATQREPLMGAAFEEGLLSVARPKIGGYLRQMLGDDSPHIEFIIDAIAGVLVMRIGLLGDDRPAEEFAEELQTLVDQLS